MNKMTVAEYAEKYRMPEPTVYHALYAKRIKGERTKSGWLVEDAPPPLYRSKTRAVTIEDFTPYELALLWLNATIMDDAIMLRSKDGFVPSYFAAKFNKAEWNRESGAFACKISSIALVHGLRKMGFTGRKDAALPAPDVDGAAFAAALIESRASFVRQLRYERGHPMDKTRAYYVPAITLCASYPIMSDAVDVMSNLGIIPRRKLFPAANKTSATLRITSHAQLDAIRTELSLIGANALFWEAFDRHTNKPYQPYFSAKKEGQP